MFVHQTWKESRLKLPDDIFEEGDDYVTLPPEFFDNLWQPDPYFLNSKIAGKSQLIVSHKKTKQKKCSIRVQAIWFEGNENMKNQQNVIFCVPTKII